MRHIHSARNSPSISKCFALVLLFATAQAQTAPSTASPTNGSPEISSTPTLLPTNSPTITHAPISTINVNGVFRNYIIHMPPGPASGMVLFLHGFSNGVQEWCADLPVSNLTNTLGFVVICPEAQVLNGDTYWRSFIGEGYFFSIANDTDEDLVFLGNLVQSVKEQVEIPLGRTFLFGCSNGGSMAIRFACERSDLIDGIATIAAQWFDPWLGWQVTDGEITCSPERKLPIWQGIGSNDYLFYNELQDMQSWHQVSTEVLGCVGEVTMEENQALNKTCHTYSSCPEMESPSQSRFCEYKNLSHQCIGLDDDIHVSALEFLTAEATTQVPIVLTQVTSVPTPLSSAMPTVVSTAWCLTLLNIFMLVV